MESLERHFTSILGNQMTREYKITQEEHRLTTEQKLKWFGYGEWVEEADTIHLEYKDYKAEIHRVDPQIKIEERQVAGGYLRGFVMVPQSHPYYGNEEKLQKIVCYNGLAFNNMNTVFLKIHIIGFSTVDLNDHFTYLLKEKCKDKDFVYRNMEFCIEECLNIIDQLIEMENG